MKRRYPQWIIRISCVMTVLIMALCLVLPSSEKAFADTKVTIPVRVSFQGNGLPSENFTVMINRQGHPDSEAITGSLTLSAGMKTGEIRLDLGQLEEGIYIYELREMKGTNPGITYSDIVYDYYVTVAPDGTVDQKAVNRDDPLDKPDQVEFTNSYRQEGPDEVVGDPPVRVKKDISLAKPPKSERFVFIMRPEYPGYPLPDVTSAGSGEIKNGFAEVYLDGEGEIEIGNITFTEVGTYRYFVSEKDTAIEGYNYDGARFTVTYEVSRDQYGRLTCNRTITRNGKEAVDECAFDNIYHPNPVIRKLDRAVKTGDPSVMWPLTALCISLIGITAVVIDRRNRLRSRKRI